MIRVYHNEGSFCFCPEPMCVCTVSCGSESESCWCSRPDLPEDSLWTPGAWVATTLKSVGQLYHFRSFGAPHREGQRELGCRWKCCAVNLCHYSLKNSLSHLAMGVEEWEIVTVTGVGFVADTEPSFYTCSSQTWACIGSPAELVQKIDGPLSFPQSLIQEIWSWICICICIYICNKFPRDAAAAAADPGATLWELVLYIMN